MRFDDTTGMPPSGFPLEAFPTIGCFLTSYVTNPALRPDPAISVNEQGQLTITVGNVCLLFSSESEWCKLEDMVTRVWDSHNAKKLENDDSSS